MAYGKDGAVFPDITYGFYSVFAELHNIKYETVPLTDDFKIDTGMYLNRNKLIVIANPNAPTGIDIPLEEIEKIIKSNPQSVVLIDEAYVDFGGESCAELTEKYDNLLCVHTYSKSRSMAGARLGFAIANEEIIKDLEKIKYSTNPYNINRLTQIAGAVAITEDDYYKENCKKIIQTREYTANALKELNFTVLPSKTNFLFAKSDIISGEDFSFLVDKYDEGNLIKSEGCLHLVGFVSFRESFLVPKGEPWQLVLFHHAPPILFPVVQGNGKKHEVFAFQFVINGSQVFGFKAASSAPGGGKVK